MKINVITFNKPAKTRVCPLSVGDMSWESYCRDVIERYRRPSNFTSANDTKNWRRECRKYGWAYKSAQVFDGHIVIWEHRQRGKTLRKKVSQILQAVEE